MRRVAITGGIGSGKSVVLQMIGELGYPIYSCDEIYKEIIRSEEYVHALEKIFPTAVRSGRIDRDILGNIVFHDATAREKLNNASHPLIMKALKQEMEKANAELVFAEVPLLFEGGFEKDFDNIIVVERTREMRKIAIQQRNAISDVVAEARIRAQFDYDEPNNRQYMQSLQVYTIRNDGNLDDLLQKVKTVLDLLLQKQS